MTTQSAPPTLQNDIDADAILYSTNNGGPTPNPPNLIELGQWVYANGYFGPLGSGAFNQGLYDSLESNVADGFNARAFYVGTEAPAQPGSAGDTTPILIAFEGISPSSNSPYASKSL